MFLKKFKYSMLMAGTAVSLGAIVGLSSPAHADYTYYGYDTDNDGYLEEDEYVDYSYDLIDTDGDNYIDETEWDNYTSIWYEPYDDIDYDTQYDFEYYDTDNDGYIEITEYENAYDNEIYEAWDTDNDGYVEYEEYNTAATMYSDYDVDGLYEW